ncbi:bifunctional UDP-N-acetylmuramoyl-tripeptide:D-alanyl-D-alanine ligase/alanine racemase [Mucilaginibacter sp. KACC 22063]|uniref:bifunctional UDP-N-acetylmuramoyl-tripeptide:D-alanyl-D-alanine ligase/alanine racemase n=1 Tax=Mucilaginibacter sp. KACC 22063 TaxID=3025666 RepID=UPI002365B30C|nr:bifunctional UDP-N-acetylmuramoyl-tripeptide:D-alanyl-D-alanine ligase/alanine racemase [Mucilaginibacter sp. KACC 22063]WDF53354.1 bifunctional UDP-N-acetylmuramoyl-tripeptide:D-alanyl-D-alanine ligase/alanine racemase [Mucilaginibacter sp. KACC 22063]
MYSIKEIRQIIGAQGPIIRECNISGLITDSRQVLNASEGLFFALKGRRDGHEFIKEAYNAGVRSFVVAHEPAERMTGANFLTVDNVLNALHILAAHHRQQFNLQVIGITGSNGKTIIKEWLYQLMANEYSIVRNPKSYNSQVGVPLSVWQITKENDLGIFEAGISTSGEMDALEAMIKPQIGIFTHLGSAHDEGFENRRAKVIEKLKLFKHADLLIYNYDQMREYEKDIVTPKRFTWSQKSKDVDLYVFSETVIAKKFYLRAKYKGKEIECLIPFLDAASVENAVYCWATMLAMGYSPQQCDDRLEHLTAVSMRLELKTGVNDCTIIDDSYNSDINSLEIALNFLNQQNQHQTKTLILSDIYQSGLQQEVLYKQVADMVKDKKIDKFIGVGEAIFAHEEYFDVLKKHFYPHTQALLKDLNNLEFSSETILIKGARSFEFERISKALSQKAHETLMEINLTAMVNNLNFYRSKLYPGVKVMVMVKAFSYGSGTFEIANVLQYAKVDYLAVAYIDEGVALRESGIKLPIMVLNPEPAAFDKMVEHKLEPELYSFNMLDEFVKFAYQQNINEYPVHLKIDTGMHRLGFEDYEIETLCDFLEEVKHIRVKSVFSHLVASDAPEHDAFTLQQMKRYEKAYLKIENALGYKFIRHISNTSAIIRWPMAQYDMVRLGIGLYGVDAAVPGHMNGLQPIASLKTNISQIKKLPAGETIGYSRLGKLNKDGKIATVRIGYADGYLRAFGNGVGKMLVKGVLVPTVGNIAMDMCMIDVSDVECKEGDEVIVFNDKQGIDILAKQIGTIPYEILTNISQRVKRVYFYE